MSKSKWVISSVLVVAIAVATGLGVAGCAKSSSVGQNGNAPSVTTGNGQPSGGSGQQQGQADGQPAGNIDPQQMQADMKTALSGLVSKGTITQDQADKVVQAFANSKPGQGPGPGQGQAPVQGQGPAQGQGQGKGPLDELVANGTLTQDQADAIKQVLPHPQERTGSPGAGQSSNQ